MNRAISNYPNLVQGNSINFKGSEQNTGNKFHVFFQKLKTFIIKPYKRITNTEKEMRTKQDAINQALKNFPMIINGEKISLADAVKKLYTENNVEERKKIYKVVKTEFGDTYQKDFQELIIARNNYAKEKGYNNFFDYKLSTTYGTKPEDLNNYLTTIEESGNENFEKIAAKRHQKIADSFGISREELQPWHYDYIPEGNTAHAIEKYLKTGEDTRNIAYYMYNNMGWDIDKQPIKIITPPTGSRLPNSCRIIEPNKNAIVNCGYTTDIRSLRSLCHELGHAVYGVGFDSKLPASKKKFSSAAIAETIAMLFENLPEREDIFSKIFRLPSSVSDRIKQDFEERYITRIRELLLSINFEKEIYSNPDQDFGKLWYKLENRILKTNHPNKYDNPWSLYSHYTGKPGLLHAYLKAEIMANQIYEEAVKQKGLLTQNKETAKFFIDNIFSHGSSWDDEKIITELTHKPINTEAICNMLKKIKI